MKKIILFVLFVLIHFGSYAQFFMENDSVKIKAAEEDTIKVHYPEFLAIESDSLFVDSLALRTTFKKEILSYRFFYPFKKNTLKMLAKMNIYFPYIESELKKNQLPDALKYVALIESSLDKRARSSAGACGLWQIMPGTAEDYGLKVGILVDERFCPLKSTQAMMLHFKRLHEKYKDWKLVLCAYNWGEGNLDDLIVEKKTSKYFELYTFLPEETQNYLCFLIASQNYFEKQKSIPKNPFSLLIPLSEFDKRVDIVQNVSIRSLKIFAKKNNLSYKVLKDLNSELRTDIIPAGYGLKIPIQLEQVKIRFNSASMDDVYSIVLDFVSFPFLEEDMG